MKKTIILTVLLGIFALVCWDACWRSPRERGPADTIPALSDPLAGNRADQNKPPAPVTLVDSQDRLATSQTRPGDMDWEKTRAASEREVATPVPAPAEEPAAEEPPAEEPPAEEASPAEGAPEETPEPQAGAAQEEYLSERMAEAVEAPMEETSPAASVSPNYWSDTPPQPVLKVDDHWSPYRVPEVPEGAKVYIIQANDTLWDLAQTHAGDPYLWPHLWDNNLYITDPHWIYPGDPLFLKPVIIPTPEVVAEAIAKAGRVVEMAEAEAKTGEEEEAEEPPAEEPPTEEPPAEEPAAEEPAAEEAAAEGPWGVIMSDLNGKKFYGHAFVTGTLSNNTSEPITNIRLKARCLDRRGRTVRDAWGKPKIEVLMPQQEVDFDVMVHNVTFHFIDKYEVEVKYDILKP